MRQVLDFGKINGLVLVALSSSIGGYIPSSMKKILLLKRPGMGVA
jgi:hypothetical protein